MKNNIDTMENSYAVVTKNSSVITRAFAESVFFKLALLTSKEVKFIQNDNRDMEGILLYLTKDLVNKFDTKDEKYKMKPANCVP